MSVYLIGNSSNCLKDSLTKREQQSLSRMQGTLRHIFENNLLLKDIKSNCEVPRLVLELYSDNKTFKEGRYDSILVKLLESASPQAFTALRQLKELIQSERAALVFACAVTPEKTPLSSEKLIEMLDLFTKNSKMLDTLDFLPPYEAGGKELLQVPVKNQVTFAELSKQSSSCDYQHFRSLAIQYLASLSTKKRLPMATYLRWLRELDISSQGKPPSYKTAYILRMLEQTTEKETLTYNLDMALEHREKVPEEDHSSIEILYNHFAGRASDPSVLFPISEDKLSAVRKQYETVLQHCQELNECTLHDLVERSRQTIDPLRILAIGRLALWRFLGRYPYNVQVWAVLCQMHFPKGAVAQIKTGEGKSMTAALLAFVLVRTRGTQGPIISPTHYLAKRDQKEYNSFFLHFGITTMDICNRYALRQKYEADILYGTASDFEFSVMTELLYNKKLFRSGIDAGFDWAIVDEMDNLSIDTSLNSARFSFPAQAHYDWVYEPILEMVRHEIAPTVSQLRQTLQTIKPVDELSDDRLGQWLQAANSALFKQEGIHYVITSKQKNDGHIKKQVRIIDVKNTGRRMDGSRWSFGVHEFVEVKHGIDPEQESLCPLSLCHPVFYTMFKSIYGITGTTGTQVERTELNDLYGLSTFDVPTHKPLLRCDNPLTIFETDEQYFAHIDTLAGKMRAAGRALLLLCETIQETGELSKRFATKNIAHEVLNEVQEKSEDEILDVAGLPGAITIATNIAGRGTDIKLSQECKNNGGLHVEIAFYPESDRVEFQARGRAGRQGQPGSSAICESKQKLAKHDLLFILLSEEQIIKLLGKKRELRAIQQKSVHVFYSAGHRVAFTYTKQFYKLLNNFYDNEQAPPYFDKVIELLHSRKIISEQTVDFGNLPVKMQPIAINALSMLKSKAYSQNGWNALVQKLLKHMREVFIQDFAVNFHDSIDQIIHTTEDQLQKELSSLAEKTTQSQKIEEQILLQTFKDCEERHKQAMLQKIDARYHAYSGDWQKYLDSSGRGLLLYLGDLINVDLSPMKADNW